MSSTIFAPSITNIKNNGPNSDTITIEPLQSGYGVTLANSLRRVLLSSISGAAVTEYRIEGVTHEFTTKQGIKEDMIEVRQAIKGIRFKVHSDQPQTITLSKKGVGTATASDIKTTADVEIVNPDHEICNIVDPKGEISIEMVVSTGRGYQYVEEASHKKSSDYISLDALFSPVLRVRYRVENTRVGQKTDLDKIIITIDTDGTVTPSETFEEANAILASQYNALAGKVQIALEQPVIAQVADRMPSNDSNSEGNAKSSPLDTSIEDLGLSARTANALVNNDIHTLNDLFALSSQDLKELKGFGSKALDEVKDKLAELEL